MRLFVAVELAEDVRRAADDVSNALQRELRETLRARWVPSDDMHLTVRFIGHVSDERGRAIPGAIQLPLPVRPFEIALGECGVFPAHGPPRVLWIGLKEGLAPLRAINDELNARLRPLGFEAENRIFNAHLTLARVKDAPRGSAAAVRDAMRRVAVPPVRCRVDHATIFESRLSPHGSTYVPLMAIPLS